MAINTPGTEGGVPNERWDLAEYALSFTAERMAAAQAAPNLVRSYGFSLGPWRFLMPAGQIAELISQPSYTPLPNTPEHCLGLANVRGNVVPYYSVHSWLNLPAPSRTGQQYYALLIGDASDGILLAIDAKPVAVPQAELEPSQLPPTFPKGLLPLIREARHAGSVQWLILDAPVLMAALARYEQ